MANCYAALLLSPDKVSENLELLPPATLDLSVTRLIVFPLQCLPADNVHGAISLLLLYRAANLFQSYERDFYKFLYAVYFCYSFDRL